MKARNPNKHQTKECNQVRHEHRRACKCKKLTRASCIVRYKRVRSVAAVRSGKELRYTRTGLNASTMFNDTRTMSWVVKGSESPLLLVLILLLLLGLLLLLLLLLSL